MQRILRDLCKHPFTYILKNMNRINTFISPSNANQFIILQKTEIENVLINNINVATLVTEEKKNL